MNTKPAHKNANVYAVVGSDESAVKAAAAELATKLAPADAGDFGVETIDACADTADQAAARIRSAIEALQTLPFFGGAKLVWLKSANFLGDDKLSRSAAVQEALEALSAALEGDLGGGEVKFLLSAPEVDKRRSFYKALAKRAELQVFDKLDSSRSGWEEAATDLVQSLGRKYRLRFDNEALDLFVLFTGGDTRTIGSELEKIDLFLAPRNGRSLWKTSALLYRSRVAASSTSWATRSPRATLTGHSNSSGDCSTSARPPSESCLPRSSRQFAISSSRRISCSVIGCLGRVDLFLHLDPESAPG